MRFRRFRPWIFGLCAVSLFISWFTLSCAAAEVDTRTYVRYGEGGMLDAWVPPRFVDNPNSVFQYDGGSVPILVRDVTSDSSAPLAVEFSYSGGGSSLYLKSGYFSYTFGFHPVTADLSRSDILDSYGKTGTLSVTFNVEFFGSDSTFHPSLEDVVVPFKSKFVFKSKLGDMYRYTLFTSDSASASDVISSVFNNSTFDMKFFAKFALGKGLSALCYFSPLLISTNPAGPGLIDGGDAEIIVDGLDHLEEALTTAVQSGVSDISRVIVQETTKVTDKLDEVTQTIINVGSDVDMSVDTSKLTSVQERSDALTDEIYSKIDSGEVETVITRRLSDPVSDSYNHSGFQLVGGWMQRIFDMGFGTIIFMCLTLGVSLFIIGRRM